MDRKIEQLAARDRNFEKEMDGVNSNFQQMRSANLRNFLYY